MTEQLPHVQLWNFWSIEQVVRGNQRFLHGAYGHTGSLFCVLLIRPIDRLQSSLVKIARMLVCILYRCPPSIGRGAKITLDDYHVFIFCFYIGTLGSFQLPTSNFNGRLVKNSVNPNTCFQPRSCTYPHTTQQCLLWCTVTPYYVLKVSHTIVFWSIIITLSYLKYSFWKNVVLPTQVTILGVSFSVWVFGYRYEPHSARYIEFIPRVNDNRNVDFVIKRYRHNISM